MLEFQKKKRIRKILYSPFTIIILVIVFGLLAKGVWGVYTKAKLSRENLHKEKIELEKLTVRQKNLAASIDYLKTDQGIENEIRTKFRAVKEGEQVAIIIDNKAAAASSTNPESTNTHGFWYRLFHWPQ